MAEGMPGNNRRTLPRAPMLIWCPTCCLARPDSEFVVLWRRLTLDRRVLKHRVCKSVIEAPVETEAQKT